MPLKDDSSFILSHSWGSTRGLHMTLYIIYIYIYTVHVHTCAYYIQIQSYMIYSRFVVCCALAALPCRVPALLALGAPTRYTLPPCLRGSAKLVSCPTIHETDNPFGWL